MVLSSEGEGPYCSLFFFSHHGTQELGEEVGLRLKRAENGSRGKRRGDLRSTCIGKQRTKVLSI
jgi:hypothetical protein